MGCPRRLFAAAALWLVTSSQRARPRRDLGASSAATSGQRYKPQRATYAGPRLGDTVNRSASPLPRPWSACERCGVVTTINPPSEAILRVGNASGWCLVVAGDRKTAGGPYEALGAAPATVAYLSAAAQETLPYGLASATPWDHFARRTWATSPSTRRGAIFDFGATACSSARRRPRPATLFDRAAFWALLLPASVHGRVADIWRGFVAQRGFGAGLRLAFLPPGVTQLRNDHDALADYMSERPFHGGTKLDTREKRTLPQLLTLAKDEVVARKDAEIAGLREELAALKGDGSDMTGLPAVLRDFTPLAMVDDVAAIADGPELDWY
ncbi:hypothetical protein JL721_9547 [Aureococcus anophagefferens]|nr:hypothetical protein JL721_9547 [Aureococcus anophagefferens]